VVAGLAAVLLSPVFLTVAIAIKLTSRGPIFYRQSRLMRGGRTFTMYKFRTMVDGADTMLDEVLSLNQASGPLFKTREDPRVTGVGKMLRKHYLDEFPQLINVLRGEMSLVGPRPCLPSERELQADALAFRFAVQQGLTGPWQINGHHGISFEAQLGAERAYIQSWSLASDFRIMARTIPLLLRRTGF
jgi:lipopolysaccharide/colanic/teichoic acid biosynthesis glycosyltransferase